MEGRLALTLRLFNAMPMGRAAVPGAECSMNSHSRRGGGSIAARIVSTPKVSTVGDVHCGGYVITGGGDDVG